MNDKIIFRFVTRTLYEDYHVYGDSGKTVYSDQTEFAPLREKGSITPEDGGCAVLFEENGKIFLVVSGMLTGKKDIAGRDIRFSFCRIFQDSGQTEKESAYNAFMRVLQKWDDAQKKVQSLLNEQNNGKGIFFDQEIFIEWLQEKIFSDVKFEICRHGDVRRTNAAIWPSKGCILKWQRSEDDEIVCMKY